MKSMKFKDVVTDQPKLNESVYFVKVCVYLCIFKKLYLSVCAVSAERY